MALAPPAADLPRPGGEDLVAVAAMIAPARSVTADVDEGRRSLARRRRIGVIREAERDVISREELEDLVAVPARVPKLERVLALLRQQRDETLRSSGTGEVLFLHTTETYTRTPC